MNAQRGFGLIVYLIAGAAILAMLGGAYWKITGDADEAGYARAKAECVLAAQVQREAELVKANTAADNLGKENEKAKIIYRTITREVDKIVERPVYRNVCFDAAGLSSVNAALAGALTPAGEPDSRVPGPDSAHGRDGRGGAAQDR